MMKRKLILFALLIMATGLRAQTLVLHHTDGTTTNVELSKNFRMDVTDGWRHWVSESTSQTVNFRLFSD